MRWENPDILWYLTGLLPLLVVLILLRRQRRRQLSRLVNTSLWNDVMPGAGRQFLSGPMLVFTLTTALMIIALARPQWGFHWREVKRRGLDIMVVVDTSKSMLAEDIKPNRLQQAKWGTQDLVKHLNGDRIGLVAFAGTGFLSCPLTTDYAAFAMTLDDIYAGIIPRGGTAVAEALQTAARGFEESPGKGDKVILLITDGEDHDGRLQGVVNDMGDKEIRIFAVGVGSPNGELIPYRDEEGRLQFLKDREGRVIKSSLNEKMLVDIARKTKGMYVHAVPGQFGLNKIYEDGIAGLKKEEMDSRMAKQYEERFMWFAGAALLLLLLETARTGFQHPASKKGGRHA